MYVRRPGTTASRLRPIVPMLCAAIVCSGIPTTGSAQTAATIDDLIRSAHIPFAAISPDGRYAAWLIARGDAARNVYDMSIHVLDTRAKAGPITLARYPLAPHDAFTDLLWLQPGAGSIQWLSDDVLLFTARRGAKTQLTIWSARSGRTRTFGEAHDRIVFESDSDWGSRLSVMTTDFIDPPTIRGAPRDYAWRIRDGYTFWGPFRNPTLTPYARTQRWSLPRTPAPTLTRDGAATEAWDLIPEEAMDPPKSMTLTQNEKEMVITLDRTPSLDGRITALVELIRTSVRRPEGFQAFSLVLEEGGGRRVLVPQSWNLAMLHVLGWSADHKTIYYLTGDAKEYVVHAVTLDGMARELFRTPALLERPEYVRRSQAVSRGGRYVLFRRSTNVIPDELIRIDLSNGSIRTIDAPNALFSMRATPEVRFYELPEQGTWGRLYLPIGYRKGVRYPLVITQYQSTPGFHADAGHEVPIIPLTAHGIAVFAMHSLPFNQPSATNDFQLEIDRVQRPLDGMHWIIRKLSADGIVDSTRVGLTGLSYGAEIAMYAYWRSPMLRAVSSSTASWDPHLPPFGGLPFWKMLEARGFREATDEEGLRRWRSLSAALNARPGMPALLLQTPQWEEVTTVPTWFALRKAGAPVDFYHYPNEGHMKIGPANRWWAHERHLDWFRFWLKDEEDEEVGKREQYTRWRELKAATGR